MRWWSASFVLLLACSKGGDTADTDTDVVDTDTDVSDAVCTEPTDIPCTDQIILDFSLHDDMVSDGDVSNTQDGGDFVTTIDATAGGFGNEDQNPWVYVKFAADGAHRVDIDDETALESMDWDIAARRFLVRLNSGDSGPSCVGAAEASGDYASVTSVPSGTTFEQETGIYDDTCAFQDDGTGLSPPLVLAGWWSYSSCVATTGQPFLIQQADGHVIKLKVESYYESGQAGCNSGGTPGSNGGVLVMRWAFVE